MRPAAVFALLVAACGGESERRADPAPSPLACDAPYSFSVTRCLDLCFPFDGQCSAAGLCSCPQVDCDPCADTCPEGTRCALPAPDRRGCYAPEDPSAEPLACVQYCDVCDPNACPGSECVRFEQDAGAFDCRAISRPGAACR